MKKYIKFNTIEGDQITLQQEMVGFIMREPSKGNVSMMSTNNMMFSIDEDQYKKIAQELGVEYLEYEPPEELELFDVVKNDEIKQREEVGEDNSPAVEGTV